MFVQVLSQSNLPLRTRCPNYVKCCTTSSVLQHWYPYTPDSELTIFASVSSPYTYIVSLPSILPSQGFTDLHV